MNAGSSDCETGNSVWDTVIAVAMRSLPLCRATSGPPPPALHVGPPGGLATMPVRSVAALMFSSPNHVLCLGWSANPHRKLTVPLLPHAWAVWTGASEHVAMLVK